MKARILNKFASTILIAVLVFSNTMAAEAAGADSVQEFRQGKTQMVFPVNFGAMVLQDDGSLWGWGCINDGSLGNGGSYDKEVPSPNIGMFRYRTYPEKLMTDVAFVNGGGLGNVKIAVKTDGTLWYTGAINRIKPMGMLVTDREYQDTFKKLTHYVISADYGLGEDLAEAIYAVKDNGGYGNTILL